MLTEYIRAGMRKAHYEVLDDDGTFLGTIPGVQGVWANEDTLEACREELRSVFEDWLLLALRDGDELPVWEGIDLNPVQTIPCGV